MAIVTQCPDCGKRVRLSPDEAGSQIICNACGRRHTAPELPPNPNPAANVPMLAESATRHWRPGRLTWTLIASAASVAIVVGGFHIYQSKTRAAIARNVAIADRMNADARELARAHHLSEAIAKYRELLEFISSREATGPALARLADEVRHDEEDVEHELALAASQPVQPIVAAPVVQPSPTTAPVVIASNEIHSKLVSPGVETGDDEVPATGPSLVVSIAPTPTTAPSIVVATTGPFVAPERVATTGPSSRPTTAPSMVATTAPATEPPGGPVVGAARPPVKPVPDNEPVLTDKQIGDSIQRGVDNLIKQFQQRTYQLIRPGAAHDGEDVLCVYALLQCGQAIDDPRLKLNSRFMAGCVQTMKRYPLDDHYGTYGRGLRATALAMFDRKEDRAVLVSDVVSLINTNRDGGYTYFNVAGRPTAWLGRTDNSNSQYGLLGVWSGAEVGIEVPVAYWTAVENHWSGTQSYDGGWSYTAGGQPRATMTCAAIASLFVCHDWLDGPKFGVDVGREPYSPALKRGLGWLEQGDNSVEIKSNYGGYALYGVERVGLASGYKFFGVHKWFPELAKSVLKQQNRDGGWGNTVDTAYALLFLSRGRHPIIMNKLRYDGYWANRPRDIANLSKFASRELERPINWQIVPMDADWSDWTDAPILYLASHVTPILSDGDVTRIRNYIQAGGMFFVQADGESSATMTPFAVDLAHRLFPQYEMKDVPPAHALFTSVYKLADCPPLKMVSNGSRILMLYSPTDICKHWQLREQNVASGKPIFQLGVNMFVYAAGRRDWRNRLDTNELAPVPGNPTIAVKIARVQYAGPWNPEPYAWTRFATWFRRQTNYGLDVHTVAMVDLDPAVYPFAHLTGTARYNPTAEEIATVKSYVEGGGVLLIDLTGGTGEFDDSIRKKLLPGAFSAITPTMLGPNHPLLQAVGDGMEDLTHPRLRPFAIEHFGASGAGVEVYKAGKGHVLFTPLDITSGLLNTGTWGIIGYDPSYSQSFMKNAILWTLDGQKDP